MEFNDPGHQGPIFAGKVQHSLDDKHRVTVPARWRRSEKLELFAIPDPRQPLGAVALAEIGVDRAAREALTASLTTPAPELAMAEPGATGPDTL